jgi:hypothetical protein
MKRLITERDVQRIAAGGKLLLDRDTIVTPAARGHAITRGIELVGEARATGAAPPKAEAAANTCGCHGCRFGAACDCSGPWPKLPDGDYLLEVRDGRVRARRIAP